MAAGGCDNQEKRYPVKTTITLDGAPLQSGVLYFHALEGGAPVGGEFSDGEIEFRAVAGKHRVEIRAYRTKHVDKKKLKHPQALDMLGHDPDVQTLPAAYNTYSILTAEVKPGGLNEFTFDLSSRQPVPSGNGKPGGARRVGAPASK